MPLGGMRVVPFKFVRRTQMRHLVKANYTVMCRARPAGINCGCAVGRYSPKACATTFMSSIILWVEKTSDLLTNAPAAENEPLIALNVFFSPGDIKLRLDDIRFSSKMKRGFSYRCLGHSKYVCIATPLSLRKGDGFFCEHYPAFPIELGSPEESKINDDARIDSRAKVTI